MRHLSASLISRGTSWDALTRAEMRIIMERAALMPSTMDVAHSAPAGISRGAIQQANPWASITSHRRSAVDLSSFE
jgi:hypothetical protein